jgi:hypothetical protein
MADNAKKPLLSRLPRPPAAGLKDLSALAKGQNSQVIIDRIKAKTKGANRRRAAGGRP